MFYMFDLFISSHPNTILISLGPCALPYILTSFYLYVRVYLLLSLHLYILISSGLCFLAYSPASSYPQICVCFLVILYLHIVLSLDSSIVCACWYHCILISLGSCTLGACWYPHILISSGPSVRTCLGNWNQIKMIGSSEVITTVAVILSWSYFHITREPCLVLIPQVGITT